MAVDTEVLASTTEASEVEATDFKMAAKDAPPGVLLEAGFAAGTVKVAFATLKLLGGLFDGRASGTAVDPAARLLKNAALALAIDVVAGAGETEPVGAEADSNILAVATTEIFEGTETTGVGRLSSELATLVWLVGVVFEGKNELVGGEQKAAV